ncbi:MAG: phosphate transport system substrate-binding protein [Verrucomicrobiota bacterium]|nr:phosphate transport system substrate-binding protein [Verrucomicrobiota bacterium]
MKLPSTLLAVITALTASVLVHGEIKARGSDSTLHVLKALSAAYTKETGQVIVLEGGGSGAGVKAALAGEASLAFLSRHLKDSEKVAGLIAYPYAKDGVAVIVHPDNPVATLDLGGLKDIFTGQNGTWPDNRPIVAFNRNADSGTREVFQELVLGKETFSPKAAVKHDGVIISSVQKIATAIAYTSVGEVDETKVRVLAIAGIKPTAATLKDGSYPIARTPTLATKGPATPEVQSFIDFVLGPKGQAIVAEHGLIALN